MVDDYEVFELSDVFFIIIGMLIIVTIHLAWRIFVSVSREGLRRHVIVIDIPHQTQWYMGNEITPLTRTEVTVGDTRKTLLVSKAKTVYGDMYIICDTDQIDDIMLNADEIRTMRFYAGESASTLDDQNAWLIRVFGSTELPVIDYKPIALNQVRFLSSLYQRVTIKPLTV